MQKLIQTALKNLRKNSTLFFIKGSCYLKLISLFFCIINLIFIVSTAKSQTTVNISATGISGSYKTGSTNGDVKNDDDLIGLNTKAAGNKGWATFDLSSLPAGSVITTAAISFTTFTSTRSTSLNEIHGFTGDPSLLSSVDLYNAIGTLSGNNQVCNPTAWAINSPNKINFNSAGISFLQTNITSNLVNIGFLRSSDNNYNIAGYSGTNGAKPTLSITYDLATTAPECATILSPANGTILIPVNSSLNWLSSKSASEYDVYLGIDPSPSLLATVPGNITTYQFIPNLISNTVYYYKIVPKNAIGQATGCLTQSFTTSPLQVYCTPPVTNCSQNNNITKVVFGTLNNPSTLCNSSGYTDFSGIASTPTISKSLTLPLSVTVGSGGTEYAGVWIDYDQNGVLDASEFTDLGSGSGSIITKNITIPTAALSGFTKMRIRIRYNVALTAADACAAYSGINNGETEDYTINITACTSPALTTLSADTTICTGGKATLIIKSGLLNDAINWQWYTGSCGGTAAGKGDTLKVSPSVNTTYYVRGEGGCVSPGLCDSVKVTINEIPFPPTIVPISPICRDSVLLLEAAGSLTPGPGSVTIESGPISLGVPDNTENGVSTTINSVIAFGAFITSISVKLNLPHTYPGDMLINLKAPNGKILNLYKYNTAQATGPDAVPNGGWFNAEINSTDTTTFRYVPTPYRYGTLPVPGPYRPDAINTPILSNSGNPIPVQNPTGFISNATKFADLFSVPSGDWTLALADGGPEDIGVLNSWSITINYVIPQGYPPVWSPAATLFTDAEATISYDGITPTFKIYAKPLVTTTYNATAVNGSCTSFTSTSVTVNVNIPVSEIIQPTDATICEFATATFGTKAKGTSPAYQWLVNTGNGIYTNIINNSNYSGTTTDTLKISSAPFTWNGYKYRCKVTSLAPCITYDTSAAATLHINPTPVVTISSSGLTKLLPGLSTTLKVSASPAAASYIWYRNNVSILSATSDILLVDIDKLGDYKVAVVDKNGCSNTSKVISISDSVSGKLFIFPNPNTGQFQIRYYSVAGNVLPRILVLYDAKGALVYNKKFTIGKSYDKMDVDLNKFSKGLYFVDLLDAAGHRLASGKVVVQ